MSHPRQKRTVVDLVEACRDVRVQDPLIGVGSQHVDLGDRVLGPTLRAEPVRARVEIRLEDRLEDQFERGLHHPVRGGRDTRRAQLAAPLGDLPLAHWQGVELAGLHLFA